MSIRNLFEEEEPVAAGATGAQTAVAVVAPSEVVVFDDYKSIVDVPGFEQFDPSDIVMPRRKIVQATTRDVDDALVGQYLDTLSGEAKKEVNVVILRYGHTRAMFTEGNFTAEALVCASTNGKTPRPNIANPQSRLCETCPMAQWGDDGEKPQCRFGYTFLMVDSEDDSPFMITFAGTAIKPAKKLISGVALKKRPFYSFNVRMGIEKKQDERGKWYAPTFGFAAMTSKAEIEHYAEMFRGFAAIQLEADAEGMASGEAVVDGDDAGESAF